MSLSRFSEREYTGAVRFQERGNRRYLQCQVKETEYIGLLAPQVRTFFEDVPMVDEHEQPIEKGPRR